MNAPLNTPNKTGAIVVNSFCKEVGGCATHAPAIAPAMLPNPVIPTLQQADDTTSSMAAFRSSLN